MANDIQHAKITELTQTLSERVRAVDETKLNPLLEYVSAEQLNKLIRRKLPTPSKKHTITPKDPSLPPILQRIALNLRLEDETDPVRRTQIFIGYCRLHNYSLNTVNRYLKILQHRNVLADNDVIRANRVAFRDSGRTHVRVVSMEDFSRFVGHMKSDMCKYNAPVLTAVYTGLRTFEILQWTTLTLYELHERRKMISITRKQTFVREVDNQPEYWLPVYNTHLLTFADQMIRLYAEEYNHMIETGIVNRLFPVTNATLVNRVRQIFFEANGFAPPHGFGIHSCRNMIATLMAQNTDNIVAVKAFLQHRRIRTTRRYIAADFSHVRREFDRLTNYALADVRLALDETHRTPSKEETPG